MKFLYSLLFLALLGSCASKRDVILRNPSIDNTGQSHSASKDTRVVDAVKDDPHSPALYKNKNKAGVNTSTSGVNYIEKFKDIAIQEMNQYGIPASIKLAQAILESGNGNSYLAMQANNHFGIKCGGVWNGKSITRSDDHPNDCFRVYNSPEESFRDHSAFLLRKRYENLFKLDKDDYRGWAKGLKAAGYATNPRYPELLIDLIERYELYKYDRQETVIEKTKREHNIEHVIAVKQVDAPSIPSEQIKAPVALVIHEVRAGQTLYAISKLYNTSVDNIKKLNNLNSENLTIGQLLVVSK